jgi:methylase of polypeptide subunit release factors
MSNNYVRKTGNPNMGWSDERRAKYSAQCKEAHANGTRHKISKKAVSLAISNGKKDAVKRKNRSEGQMRRHREASVKSIKEILANPPKVDDQANMKRIQVANQEPLDPLNVDVANAVVNLFDLIEDHLGVRPEYDDFLNDAVEDKLARCKEALCR